MANIIGVRFKAVGKVYYFDPLDFNVEKNNYVIVETARGIEIGEVVFENRNIDDDEIVKPLKPIIRIANEKDLAQKEENKKKEKEAYSICLEKIAKHKLDMKLVEVEYAFDGSKVLFYFTADGRIDFRELVKDLATVFKTRIELRQIGVRDESKAVGSYGICGRRICCADFLGEFEPVSINMAKKQGLSLNPSKISGSCGRLMCCLKYEQDSYDELLKVTPRVGAVVKTPMGVGTVEYVSLLKGILKVKIETEKETVYQDYSVSDIKMIKNGKNVEDLEKIDEDLLKNLE
ncbi:MAG: stage 0 sporulation family protein [Clostridia bacterium]|nr:stage 0 sporulation family protein [Clostridia bacterium]